MSLHRTTWLGLLLVTVTACARPRGQLAAPEAIEVQSPPPDATRRLSVSTPRAVDVQAVRAPGEKRASPPPPPPPPWHAPAATGPEVVPYMPGTKEQADCFEDLTRPREERLECLHWLCSAYSRAGGWCDLLQQEEGRQP